MFVIFVEWQTLPDIIKRSGELLCLNSDLIYESTNSTGELVESSGTNDERTGSSIRRAVH